MLPGVSAPYEDDVHSLFCSAFAAFVWLCWDVAIHLDVEVECMWLRPTSWVKWTYFLVRYAPIAHHAVILKLSSGHWSSDSTCKGWIYYQLVFILVLTLLVDTVLAVRLYILYGRNRFITVFLGLAFVAEIAAMVTTLAIVSNKIAFLPSCLIVNTPDLFCGFWMSSLLFETLLFILTLYKFFQSVRGQCRGAVMVIFYRDGTWAFAIIFVAMLINTLMFKFSTTPLIGVGYSWALSAMSFAGSHLLLNVRRLAMTSNLNTRDATAYEHGDNKARNDRRTFLTTAIDAPEAYESMLEQSEESPEEHGRHPDNSV